MSLTRTLFYSRVSAYIHTQLRPFPVSETSHFVIWWWHQTGDKTHPHPSYALFFSFFRVKLHYSSKQRKARREKKEKESAPMIQIASEVTFGLGLHLREAQMIGHSEEKGESAMQDGSSIEVKRYSSASLNLASLSIVWPLIEWERRKRKASSEDEWLFTNSRAD